jgi:hypothetical protein
MKSMASLHFFRLRRRHHVDVQLSYDLNAMTTGA